MDSNLDAIVTKAQNEIKVATSLVALEKIKNEYLGQNGLLTRSLKSAMQLPVTVRDIRKRAILQAEHKVKSAVDKKSKELK